LEKDSPNVILLAAATRNNNSIYSVDWISEGGDSMKMNTKQQETKNLAINPQEVDLYHIQHIFEDICQNQVMRKAVGEGGNLAGTVNVTMPGFQIHRVGVPRS
jgi:hypothetical protein